MNFHAFLFCCLNMEKKSDIIVTLKLSGKESTESMKYAVMICGGLSDRTIPDQNDRTPLSVARTPCMDGLSQKAEIGLAKTVEITEQPAAEKAVLSVLGYDPKRYFKGAAPFCAANQGITAEADDVIFQCSLVRLSDSEIYEEKTMLSEYADVDEKAFDKIFRTVSETFGNDIFRFVRGSDNRIFLIWKRGEAYAGEFSPPSKALEQCIGDYLPKGDFVQPLYDMMRQSSAMLENGISLWIWDEGVNPQLESFQSKFGMKGCVMADTDFVRGIAKLAGMKVLSCDSSIPQTVMRELADGQDIVFVYQNNWYADSLKGDFKGKVKSVEKFDKDIIQPVTESLQNAGEDFGIMIVSELAASVYLKRYCNDPVPYLIYRSNDEKSSGSSSFNENTAADSPYYIAKPCELLHRLISRPEQP